MNSITTPAVWLPLAATAPPTIALVGNPNTGKTTLFNRLTGLRAKTANFPGTTIERRVGALVLGGRRIEVEDLPGLYGLTAGNIEERVAGDALRGVAGRRPAAALVVVEATNLARNLYLVSQVRELDIPVLIALNMIDLAESEGLRVDTQALARELGAPVVALSARTGQGLGELRAALAALLDGRTPPVPLPKPLAACGSCTGCAQHSARFDWAESVAANTTIGTPRLSAARTARIDRVLTHPVWGLAVFAAVMASMFVALFALAELPMAGIEYAFSSLGAWVGGTLAEGDARSFIVDGVIGGVGGVIVFLPQICILFFLLSLLEDSGYLARAAFVMDKLMGKVGLPGKAFVPMLSAHACAIPALMSTRVIEDRRDRLVAILVLPLLTCSARLPVYAMITALLFAGRPLLGGLVFAGAYAFGIAMALGAAWMFKRTLLPGASRPLVLELPTYKVPSLRNALLAMRDRGGVFLRKAGGVILLISIALWTLSTYPKLPAERLAGVAPPSAMAELRALQAEATAAETAGATEAAEAASARAASIAGRYRLEYALAGRIGKWIEPIFAPLGFDWRIDIGVLSSFAARETLVSTLAIVYGVGADAADDPGNLRDTLRAQVRADGTPVFGPATAFSLLVFFALAMQCLPTQAVTRRETGSWKYAALQFAYMTALAYAGAFCVYQVLSRLGLG